MKAVTVRASVLVCLLLAPSWVRAQPTAGDAATGDAGNADLGAALLAASEPPVRRIALSYNPFTLHLNRASIDAEVLMWSHHVLTLTVFFATTTTNEDSFGNVFCGFGSELGYRYYAEANGPRGWFVGPSLLLGSYRAIPALGTEVHFSNVGGAVDVGYQAIVADRWVVGLGAGLQYTRPSEDFPPQELPASVYARAGVRPRLLLALGIAFGG